MGDDIQIISTISTNNNTISTNNTTISLPMFSGMLKNVVCFPAVLLLLSLATSTINILIYTSVLFQWLAFFLLLSSIFISGARIVTLFIYFIERYFVLKNIKVFCILFALRTSVECFFGFSSVLLSWFLLIKPHVSIFVFHFLTSTLATSVIAIVMSMVMIVILKVLDFRFHDQNFFENIQVLISNEYVLQTLLGSIRETTEFENNNMRALLTWIKRAFNNFLLIMSSRLHTICDEVGKGNLDLDHQVENVIYSVLKNITNNELRDIQENDLLLVMEKEAITDFLRLFDGASESKKISQESLRNYVIKVCNDRKHAVQLLNCTSKVIEELNINVLVIQSLLVVLVWCLLMGVGTTKSLAIFSLLLSVFGYICKTNFDGAMLAIVMHPFDIGDHCIIDDEQLVVENIGLVKTEFLKENGMKLELQSSVLLTKSINNLNRSSNLTDTFEIFVSSTTWSSEIAAALKLKIDELIESNPENWHAVYCFNDMGNDDMKQKYNLEITDVRKFQNYKVKKERRSELILNLRQFLHDLEIMNFTIK